jgi:phospholipid/cholesterol/gamma-HCH transport system substrate-binding protein
MMAWLRPPRTLLAAALAVLLVGGLLAAKTAVERSTRSTVIGYFDNSTGLYVGDDVRIRGVSVGRVTKIQPEPLRTKITFWFDAGYKVPAEAKAVILSPQLVTGRAIQLTPPYSGGPTMASGAVIDRDRTAVPVEWDEIRTQLERLTEMLQPAKPGGVSSLGAVINSAAGNLRGRGEDIRSTVVKLSQTISVLNDHSTDVFGTIRNLSTLVSGLRDSSDLLAQLNINLAEVSALLADDPNKIGRAVDDLNGVVTDVQSFVAENSEPIGTASEKLQSISSAVAASLDDIKQFLHVAPNVAANFNNIYEPANGSLTGALQVNNFANPISFLCGAIEAASRMGAEQASKLCVQYLAPIVKNRQYNFPPLGENLFVGAQARPNEVTYSEDWLRPDFVPPQPGTTQPASSAPQPLPAETPAPVAVAADPAAGLPGLMTATGAGG